MTEKHFLLPNSSGLRFISALMVFFFHCFTINRGIWGSFYENFWFQKAGILLSRGHLGVSFFFVLSGFLITLLLLKEKAATGKINLLYFLMRRFLRIWPLYLVVVLFGFFVFPHLPYGLTTIHELWRFLLFLSNFDEIIVGMKDQINFLTATWSVSVEEQFYLAWGIIIGLLGFKRISTFWFFFTTVIFTSLLFRWYYLEDQRMLYFHTLSVISDFAVGGIAALLAFQQNRTSILNRIPKSVNRLVYLAGIALIVFEDHLFVGNFFIFERFLPSLFFAYIVLDQAYSTNTFWQADRIPFFFRSGKITYGFYLFHCISIYYISCIFQSLHWTNTLLCYLLFVAVSFISTYLLTHLSFYYFEEPILKLKRYFR